MNPTLSSFPSTELGTTKTFAMAMNLWDLEGSVYRASGYERLVDGRFQILAAEDGAFAAHSWSGQTLLQVQVANALAVTADVLEADPFPVERTSDGLLPVHAQAKSAVVETLVAIVVDTVVAAAAAAGAASSFAKERPSTPVDEKGLAQRFES